MATSQITHSSRNLCNPADRWCVWVLIGMKYPQTLEDEIEKMLFFLPCPPCCLWVGKMITSLCKDYRGLDVLPLKWSNWSSAALTVWYRRRYNRHPVDFNLIPDMYALRCVCGPNISFFSHWFPNLWQNSISPEDVVPDLLKTPITCRLTPIILSLETSRRGGSISQTVAVLDGVFRTTLTASHDNQWTLWPWLWGMRGALI